MNTNLNRNFSKEIIQMVNVCNHRRNTKLNQKEDHLIAIRKDGCFQTDEEYEALGMECRKGNSCSTSEGMQIHTAVTGSSMGVVQNFKNRTTVWSSNSTPGYVPRGNENIILNSYLYTSAMLLQASVAKVKK